MKYNIELKWVNQLLNNIITLKQEIYSRAKLFLKNFSP